MTSIIAQMFAAGMFIDGQTATLLIVPLFGILATNILNYLARANDARTLLERDRLNREEDRKDAQQLRDWTEEDLAIKAELLQGRVLEEAALVKVESKKHSDLLLYRISENTEITKLAAVKANDAYKEANDAKTKLDDLRREGIETNRDIGEQLRVRDNVLTSRLADLQKSVDKTSSN
jgi:hypothetical protein